MRLDHRGVHRPAHEEREDVPDHAPHLLVRVEAALTQEVAHRAIHVQIVPVGVAHEVLVAHALERVRVPLDRRFGGPSCGALARKELRALQRQRRLMRQRVKEFALVRRKVARFREGDDEDADKALGRRQGQRNARPGR